MEIRKYRTHYEITGYRLGHCIELERDFSTWDNINFKQTDYFYYEGSTMTLYLPAGVPSVYLEDKLNVPVIIDHSVNDKTPMSFSILKEPRDESQKESVRFLLGKSEYSHTQNQSQLILSLPGGGGKTYCMVSAMSFFNSKAIIITHNDDIRNQWLERLKEYTNLHDENIEMCKSSDQLRAYVTDKKAKSKLKNIGCFICTHRLLGSYMNTYGFKSLNELFLTLGIGIKIIDEAHKEFKSTLMVDYATNVWKNFYLTATFVRSDHIENNIFQKSFNQIYKLVKNDELIGRERNVIYIPYFVKSELSVIEDMRLKVKNKFNVHRYFEYEMYYKEIFSAVELWLDWYYNKKGFTGKTFILSSKTDSCDLCDKIAKKVAPDKISSVHYTGNKVDDLGAYDIISATDRMLGTGIDLGGLNLVINLVPISSKGNIDQIIHRLMRGKDNEDAYYIEVIDESATHTMKMYKGREKVIRTLVKRAIPFKKQY